MAPKRTKKEEGEGEEKVVKKRAPKKVKKSGLQGGTDAERGWYTQWDQPKRCLYKVNDVASTKIAAFDFDSTLVATKSGMEFPRSADDWRLYRPSVASKLQELHKEGFKLVVISNQGGIRGALDGKAAEKFTERFDQFAKSVGVPIAVFAAPDKGDDDDMRKPKAGMWELAVGSNNGGKSVDKKASFFVGDAAGGGDDFSDSDLKFAEAVGVAFHHAKDYFPAGGASGNEAVLEALRGVMEMHKAKQKDPTVDPDAKKKAGFGLSAMRKAIEALEAFPGEITPAAKKEVLALKGVGKGTWEYILQFLTDGSIAAVEEYKKLQAEGAGGEKNPPPAAPKSEAAKFL